MHMRLAEVENCSLSSLKTYGWEINHVWADFEVCECFTKRLVVPPKRDRAAVEINEGSDDVAD